eukprot:CAMPEP_0171623284 /NCGR_PEP_ID=MMETSP0990-20121206/17840_1 /TAXON_ID=483369 /ORGANISM="non described non described, Strain CCMP2098" /LENGTH=323 /DNA_ID=CAMNT_0012189429 /DNA_START=9 /DNA_END=980 /DNA_ORIENTATION=-
MMMPSVRVLSLLAFTLKSQVHCFTFKPRFQSRLAVSFAEKSAKAPDGGSTGHIVQGMKEPSSEEKAIQERVAMHQQDQVKLGASEEIRSLVQYNHGFAVMSTNSQSIDGYPSGSIVGFAPDEQGRPIFIFSGMSTHTQDLLKDGRCSLTVASKSFKGPSDGRVNIVGDVVKVPAAEREACRDIYLKKHPGAFWVDFGDFTWFRLETIKAVRFVGGFARAGAISSEDYFGASPDPIQQFAEPVMKHMNDDHGATALAMVNNLIGVPATTADIVGLDRLGMYIKCDGGPMGASKLRLAFPRPAENRKDVKDLIVELSKAAALAAP